MKRQKCDCLKKERNATNHTKKVKNPFFFCKKRKCRGSFSFFLLIIFLWFLWKFQFFILMVGPGNKEVEFVKSFFFYLISKGPTTCWGKDTCGISFFRRGHSSVVHEEILSCTSAMVWTTLPLFCIRILFPLKSD